MNGRMAVDRNGKGQPVHRAAAVVLRILAALFFLALSLVGGLIGLLFFVEFHGENTKAPNPVFSKVWGGFAMADAVLCLAVAVHLLRTAGGRKAQPFAGRAALIALAAAFLLLAVALLRSEPR